MRLPQYRTPATDTLLTVMELGCPSVAQVADRLSIRRDTASMRLRRYAARGLLHRLSTVPMRFVAADDAARQMRAAYAGGERDMRTLCDIAKCEPEDLTLLLRARRTSATQRVFNNGGRHEHDWTE